MTEPQQWYVHILGPDDIEGPYTIADAFRFAAEVNEASAYRLDSLTDESFPAWAVPTRSPLGTTDHEPQSTGLPQPMNLTKAEQESFLAAMQDQQPTVQVPVSLREQVQALRDEMFAECDSEDHLVPLTLLIERLDALLSQPCTCPSGDGSLRWPCPTHLPTAQVPTREEIALTIEAIHDECGDDYEAMAEAVLALLSQRCPTAEPPRIEDMAPVATHSSGEHRRVRLGQGDDLPVCDTCINVLGLNVRWDHAILRPDHDAASTIRDVIPPAVTP
ncbi:hypothetical protein [Curtobacterium sp. UCD-KPL2560]|uniref:hypothetical protein n=1 Tax=Curtobacterium sp. UCD-KPL2560 TaxID=1885315 RepID=UPI0008254FF1|nr:hypothetical protein [Curtobacterium sp. UCD-KPL2560]